MWYVRAFVNRAHVAFILWRLRRRERFSGCGLVAALLLVADTGAAQSMTSPGCSSSPTTPRPPAPPPDRAADRHVRSAASTARRPASRWRCRRLQHLAAGHRPAQSALHGVRRCRQPAGGRRQAGNVYRYPAAVASIAPSAPAAGAADQRPRRAVERGAARRLPVRRRNARDQPLSRTSRAAAVGPREAVVTDLPARRPQHAHGAVRPGRDDVCLGRLVVQHLRRDRRAPRGDPALCASRPRRRTTSASRIGLRNAVGLAIQPATGLLWATVNERDNQGNEIPPDLVTIVRQGQNFGWPGCQPPDATPQDPAATAPGITPPTHRPPGPQRAARPGVLHRPAVPGRVRQRPVRRPARLVEPRAAGRAEADPRSTSTGARPVSAQDFATGWQNRRRQPLGPPGRRDRRPRRQPDRLGRPGRHACTASPTAAKYVRAES